MRFINFLLLYDTRVKSELLSSNKTERFIKFNYLIVMKMEIKNKAKNLTAKILYKTADEAASFVAPFAAVSSMAGTGGNGILDNLVAIYHVPKTIGYLGYAFAKDMGIRTTTIYCGKELTDILLNAGKNLIERPLETLGVAGGVYLGIKYAPRIIRATARFIKNRKR